MQSHVGVIRALFAAVHSRVVTTLPVWPLQVHQPESHRLFRKMAHSRRLRAVASSQLLAFCAPLLPCHPGRSAKPVQITMRKPRRKSSRPKGPQGPERLSKEQQAKIEGIASTYGVRPPRPGDSQDRQYTASKPASEAPPPSLYQRLAAAVGVETLDSAERVVYVALGLLLAAFLGAGLAISAEAFLKASGREVPEGVDAFVTAVEGGFTPIVLVFLALSSLLGVYKQSQLSSGATSYEALSEDEKRR